MKMKIRQISPRDQEMLSAYLDGQLSSKEITRLQKRLQDDSQMQIALDELRTTRNALRSLPKLRAPRNFTLTPQMVGRRTAARRAAYPVFGYASLVATLLLALIFVADRTSFINTAQVTSLQSAAQATQMEGMVQTMVVESLAAEGITTPQAEAMQLKESPLSAAQESADNSRLVEATAEESASSMMMASPEPTLELFAAPVFEATPTETEVITASELQSPAFDLPVFTVTPTPTPWLINGTEVLGIGGGAPDTPHDILKSTPTETPTSTPTPTDTCTSEPTPTLTETPTPSDTPLPTDTPPAVLEALPMQLAPSETPVPQANQEILLPGEQADQIQPASEPGGVSTRTIFMAVEIVLGLLAVGSAVIFIYLYRKAG